ncbi:MAG: hypothetical protein DMD64_15030, partial [Gemmatimonadetes bacterium]
IVVNGMGPSDEAVEDILGQIGLAPNGRPWDSGACGYSTCREFAVAAAQGRTTLKSCPRYLERQAALAQQQAAVDALTGLASFRVLRDRLASEVARCHRTGDHFAVLFLDLDNFKQVNDQFGHEAGNAVLKETAHRCSVHIRLTDVAGRYGGDEFVVVLVGTGQEGALGVAEKIRAAVQEAGAQMGYPEGLVTVSIGVAEYRPENKDEDVLVAADRALYRAKAAGRTFPVGPAWCAIRHWPNARSVGHEAGGEPDHRVDRRVVGAGGRDAVGGSQRGARPHHERHPAEAGGAQHRVGVDGAARLQDRSSQDQRGADRGRAADRGVAGRSDRRALQAAGGRVQESRGAAVGAPAAGAGAREARVRREGGAGGRAGDRHDAQSGGGGGARDGHVSR